MKSGIALLIVTIAAVTCKPPAKAPAGPLPSPQLIPDLVAGVGDTTRRADRAPDVNVVTGITGTIGDTLGNLGKVVTGAVNPITGGVDTVVDTIKDITGIVNSTEHKVAKVVTTFVSNVNGPTEFFDGLANTANKVTSTTAGIINGISETTGNVVSGVLGG